MEIFFVVGLLYAVVSFSASFCVNRVFAKTKKYNVNAGCALALLSMMAGVGLSVRVDVASLAVFAIAIAGFTMSAYAALCEVEVPWWIVGIAVVGFIVDSIVHLSPWVLLGGFVTALPFGIATGIWYALRRDALFYGATLASFIVGVVCGVVPGFVVVLTGTIVAFLIARQKDVPLSSSPLSGAMSSVAIVALLGLSVLSG